MSKIDKVVHTKKITAEEAEQCAAEQIQFIDTIQPHGVVLIIDAKSYKIVRYSQNISAHIDIPDSLNMSDETIFSTVISDWIEFESEHPFAHLTSSGIKKTAITSKGLISGECWECLAHITGPYICLEFIPCQVSKIETDELIVTLSNIIVNIRNSNSPEQLYKTITKDFQLHTGYDRVMLYQFHPDWSGEVLAESVSSGNEIRFEGLRFPAEDIPRQARELYKKNTLRIIAEVDAQPTQMISEPTNKEPVDMGLAILRSMSKMHIQYLQNMKIKATMTLSLMYRGKLWGLMSFHHNSPKLPPHHVVSQVKATCELFTEVVTAYLHNGLNLANVEKNQQNKSLIQETFNNLDKNKNLHSLFRDALESLRTFLDFDYIGIGTEHYCALYKDDQFIDFHDDESEQLLSLIKPATKRELFTDSLIKRRTKLTIPELEEMAGISILSSAGSPRTFVFFGRRELERSVAWAGKPGTVDIVIKNGERVLEPRSSFGLWKENVKGYCKNWEEDEKALLHSLFEEVKDLISANSTHNLMEQLERSANFDSLTGLANRQFLKQYIEGLEQQDLAARSLTLFFIDLDNFKEVNDFMGHSVGDIVLKAVSKRLQHCVRPNDLVVRLGGDEFLVVIDNKDITAETALKLVIVIGDKIISAINKPIFEQNHSIVTTPSIGINIAKLSQVSFDEMMKQADIALYAAKSEGKNRFYLFSEKDQEQFNKMTQLSHDLREAIRDKLLEVYFQPQINAHGQKTGAEALCRWNNKKYGPISPDVFISVAEKNNYIYELGLLVFDMVCQQIKRWSDMPEFSTLETVSINVSPMQIVTDGFVKDIINIVETHGIDAKKLRLEVTETVFMTQFKDVAKTLKSLRASGFSVSLDDFGTGFSSLSHLVNLPIDEVKIDKSFIANMCESDNSLTMVEGIISLCKKLNLEVVAEGVENKLQLNILKGLGCDTFQGFLFSKAVKGQDFFEV